MLKCNDCESIFFMPFIETKGDTSLELCPQCKSDRFTTVSEEEAVSTKHVANFGNFKLVEVKIKSTYRLIIEETQPKRKRLLFDNQDYNTLAMCFTNFPPSVYLQIKVFADSPRYSNKIMTEVSAMALQYLLNHIYQKEAKRFEKTFHEKLSIIPSHAQKQLVNKSVKPILKNIIKIAIEQELYFGFSFDY